LFSSGLIAGASIFGILAATLVPAGLRPRQQLHPQVAFL
jgi:uncharacterized oligopeptide transporter (OPT) family protein